MAEIATPIKVQATVLDLERGSKPQITALPIATEVVDNQRIDIQFEQSAPTIYKIV